MTLLQFSDLKDQQLVDTRSQLAFQKGHVKNALNLNPGNFKKYAESFLSLDKPLIFITDEEDTHTIYAQAKEQGFTHVLGHLLINNIPKEQLQQSDTIPAKAFLNLDPSGQFTLLDVRHPDEITRPAPQINLINTPLEDLSKNNSSLDKEKTVYTLCGSGNRGTTASSFLEMKGYHTVIIDSGMKGIENII